ncbi:hypothetical protein AVEN_258118-1 [Araneus ventricosus]|uniref:Uncharacterized protein n=1 Tax=Araneus ventricosus TaxID=182803 RepID=A0A4Y2WDA6_ARAVE|nr:hypothetical protein AVEN_258118-1 [Araneus ventricosus]
MIIRSKIIKDHQIQDGQRSSDPRWTKIIRSRWTKIWSSDKISDPRWTDHRSRWTKDHQIQDGPDKIIVQEWTQNHQIKIDKSSASQTKRPIEQNHQIQNEQNHTIQMNRHPSKI